MSDVISEYQKWKQQGENLRAQAKHAMESRFRELLAEAVQVSEEYRADFGGVLKPPAPVTAFRYKASARAKARKAVKPKPAARAPERAEAPAAEPKAKPAGPKVTRLQKRLATARQKLEEAKAGGAPTRVLEDKIYEIEDELRLTSS
jgi:hypothetical protein